MTPVGSHTRGFAWRHRRAQRRVLLCIVGLLAAATLFAQGSITTNASWSSREWVHARVGTSDCTDPDVSFANRGEGRALGGDILGFDLDGFVAASGVEVTNNGARSRETPGSATSLGDHAYANPLNVEALSLIDLDLGRGLLQLPLNNSTGVIGQFGQATKNGLAVGAAGYLASSGGIATSPGNNYPELATLQISNLVASLDPGLSTTLGNVADVNLKIGAVTGRASLDGCVNAWATDLTQSLTREYLVSHVRTELTSPTVGALVTGVESRIAALESAVNGLVDNGTGNGSATGAIKVGVTNLVNGVLGAASGLNVRLGSINLSSLSATVDTSGVRALLTNALSDSGGVLTINLSTGTITVDTGALLAAAYPDEYANRLNALPPNTDLLADAHVLNTLAATLNTTLQDWLTQVNTALASAINAVALNVALSVNLEIRTGLCPLLCLYVPLAQISISTVGTLSALTTTTSTTLLGLELLTPLVDALLDDIVAALVSGVGGVVQTAVGDVLSGFSSLPVVVTNLTAPIVSAVSTLYTALYLNGIVSLTVNAQNDPLTGSPEPPDWAALDAGRYDVAALRVGVLEGLADGVHLYLGRGSVGRSCSQAELDAGACSGY